MFRTWKQLRILEPKPKRVRFDSKFNEMKKLKTKKFLGIKSKTAFWRAKWTHVSKGRIYILKIKDFETQEIIILGPSF